MAWVFPAPYNQTVISPYIPPPHSVWPPQYGPQPVHDVSLDPLADDLPLPEAAAIVQPPRRVVADVMSTRVVTAQTHQSARHVLQVLSAHHISGMPVVNRDGELAGLISQSDLMAHLAGGGDLLVQVNELMAPFICFATPDATLEEAADLMLQHGIHRVVVLRDREIAGIVTSLDLLRGMRQS